MYATQTRAIESFVRVRAFLEAHPATGELTYRGAQETLDEVIERVRAHAGTQLSGRALARAELRSREQLIKRLMDRHMRPIVSIARAQIEPHSDVRLPVVVRMPWVWLGETKMLQACDGMMEAARVFEELLIENGLPSDFLSRFKRDRDALEQTFAVRATLTGSQRGAPRSASTACLGARARRSRCVRSLSNWWARRCLLRSRWRREGLGWWREQRQRHHEGSIRRTPPPPHQRRTGSPPSPWIRFRMSATNGWNSGSASSHSVTNRP